MDISKLQGAQSFTVTPLDRMPSRDELKALEKNGKVDLIVQDGAQVVHISGESIDINEYNAKMGQALPTYQIGAFGSNPDLKPLQHMDRNQDGRLTEAETRHNLTESLNQGGKTFGKTISGAIEVGGFYGMAYGYHFGGMTGATIGTTGGQIVGGLIGLASSPFTSTAKVYSTIQSQKDVQTWNLTEHLKSVR